MSEGDWETVRGSHRDSQEDTDPQPVPSAESARSRSGIRQSTEVIIGWRVWGLTPLPPQHARAGAPLPFILVSTFMNTVWQPGQPMKACCGANVLRHGIHAFMTAPEAMTYMGERRKPIRHVFGEVSLWGRVVVHERGYRAECAYPRRILVPKQYRGSRDIVNELRRSYGIETDWTT